MGLDGNEVDGSEWIIPALVPQLGNSFCFASANLRLFADGRERQLDLAG